MSKQVSNIGPSMNTRGRGKRSTEKAITEPVNSKETILKRDEVKRMIDEGISEAIPKFLDALEKREASKKRKEMNYEKEDENKPNNSNDESGSEIKSPKKKKYEEIKGCSYKTFQAC